MKVMQRMKRLFAGMLGLLLLLAFACSPGGGVPSPGTLVSFYFEKKRRN